MSAYVLQSNKNITELEELSNYGFDNEKNLEDLSTYETSQSEGWYGQDGSKNREELNDTLSSLSVKIYGFHIDSSVSDPSNAVTYVEDNANYTPAYMDFSGGSFNWGSWKEDEFFMPRPCMVKYDGTVDYYLDPNDYSKKEDGTASDVTDLTYGGNAMMEWGRDGQKIWYSITPDSGTSSTSATIRFSNQQIDDTYHCWSFINKNNVEQDHFYTPIYQGYVYSSRLRSMSGVVTGGGYTISNERTYAQANGDGWDIECYADWILINLLLTLMIKSLDSQSAIGLCTTDSTVTSGQMNSDGLFYGQSTNSSTTKIKVFGMEYWWGNNMRRLNGFHAYGYTVRYKLTQGTADGSTATDYQNTSVSGYLTGGTSLPSSGFLTRQTFGSTGYLYPNAVTTSSSGLTTYYCDAVYTISTSSIFPAVIGGCTSSSSNTGYLGAWAMFLLYTGTGVTCTPRPTLKPV